MAADLLEQLAHALLDDRIELLVGHFERLGKRLEMVIVRRARRLSLTTLGFLQFLSPSLQLVLAVTFFGEPFTRERGISFFLIWSAVALFAFDSWRGHRQTHAELEPVTET